MLFCLKMGFLWFTPFCCKICFVAIYALLCGEKWNQILHMWRKNYKYQVCIISASSLHHECIMSASWVRHWCIIIAILAHHQRVISSSCTPQSFAQFTSSSSFIDFTLILTRIPSFVESSFSSSSQRAFLLRSPSSFWLVIFYWEIIKV